MAKDLSFRPYNSEDHDRCFALFDANCPEFFAPNERADYQQFLTEHAANYEVCELDGDIAGGFGFLVEPDGTASLRWILIDPGLQGQGAGTAMMERLHSHASEHGVESINIGASHKSAPFFARFGATVVKEIENGWGPHMHRVDMTLSV